METIDEEFLSASMNFIDRQHKANKPFFVWFNSTRMHIFTHLKKESEGKTGRGIYADGMVEHDGQVGQLLKKLDDLGITKNTIVIYTTDNGAEKFSWPDGGTSPFKGEKASTWEGGIRVPFMIRWPEKIKGGRVSNEIISLEDCLPTLLAAVGDEKIKEKLLKGEKVGDKNFKVHIDGYNFLPYLEGAVGSGPRDLFFAFVDDGSLGAMRYKAFKFHFSTQTRDGIGSWFFEQEKRKAPLIIDLRADPFEMAPEDSSYYEDWLVRHMYVMVPIKNLQLANSMGTFKGFPPAKRLEVSRRCNRLIKRLSRGCKLLRPPPTWGGLSVQGRGEELMKPLVKLSLIGFAAAALVFMVTIARAQNPLPSWNDGPAKKAIIEFVAESDEARLSRTSCRSPSASPRSTTTARSGPSSRCISSRSSLFDRVKALAPQHPEWKDKEPFASLLKGDVKAALAGGERRCWKL